MVLYEGLFFEGKEAEIIHSLEEKQLDYVNDELHCTFKYKPIGKEIFNEIVGKSFDIYIVGYASDGMNSGFEVVIPEELKKYYINYEDEEAGILKVPHITASLSKGAKAVNTKNLKFKKLSKPVKITGRFGCWVKENNKEYLSYKPCFSKKAR